MRLEAHIVTIPELGASRVEEMLELMDSHYEGVTRDDLLADLRAKERVILLMRDGTLRGFSTQTWFWHGTGPDRVRVVFSGDTIIDRHDWGSPALAVAWGRMMLGLLDEHPDAGLYWLLTSKGYKTYRFLTVFFREFVPKLGGPTDTGLPALRDAIAGDRFGPRYDAATGILRAEPGAQRLRQGVADLDERRLRDLQVGHFQQLNPGHARGDELVCLARFHPDNLHPYILRQLLADGS
ncbi:MAG: hypothetical protein J0M04_18045 [Verrucomicrobia bacterium]|nr:hypothetical protein [Verrucomicrobiota bacterium]